MNNDRYITVSKVNEYIARKFVKDRDLANAYVKGEISNFKVYPSGHCYFTLKDENSNLKGVMYRNYASRLDFQPKDGMKVLVKGKIEVYKKRGEYSLYASMIKKDGLGDLYLEFEKLKKKLDKEGLFDKSYKKQIPKFPKRIGVVTAETGAAIKDIITTISRRWPFCEVILFPSLVQGENASNDIVRQIKRSENFDLDVLIVGRGGGSIEDLWSFNEEIVGRAIFECNIPVISAVGHEVDYTISDFVADLRAPTPTAAAELAVPNFSEIKNKFDEYNRRINKSIKIKFNERRNKLENICSKRVIRNPETIYRDKQLDLDTLIAKVEYNSKSIISSNKYKLKDIESSFIIKNPNLLLDSKIRRLSDVKNSFVVRNPDLLLDNFSNEYNKLKLRLSHSSELLINKKEEGLKQLKNNHVFVNPNQFIDKKRNLYFKNFNKLEVLNPLLTLKRGYTLTKVEGKVVSSSKNLKKGDKLEVKFTDGSVNTEVL